MENTSIKVKFQVIGDDLEPSVITQRLSIQPVKTWRKGEALPRNTDISRDFSCWLISTDYEESIDINNQLRKILDLILVKRDELITMRDELKVDYLFEVVIKIENNMKPAMHLDKELIKFASEIEAEFDFDLYIYS
jgi:hypothetical protein